ncbi:MAG: response regulator [Sedimentisphaerales bacterium]|nr:response regulator [Sedimentisphaerales bacterium]
MEKEDFSGIRDNGPLPDPREIKIPEDLESLIFDYVESSASMLQELEVVTLAYEAGSNRQENAAAVRRILHKLKGEAGMVGIDEIYKFCHQAEFAVEELSDDERSDMLLRVKDWLDAAFQHLTGVTNSATRQQILDTAGSNDEIEHEPQKQGTAGKKSGLKILIAEDDFTCRKLLQSFLSGYGDCFVAINGREAIEAVKDSIEEGRPYDMICLDIMMPEIDGHEALESIRRIESEHGIMGLDGVKVIITSALDDSTNVVGAFRTGCEAYIVKPISKRNLLDEMEKLGLVNLSESGSIK